MTDQSSYRTILRSTSIMGLASGTVILSGLVKMKAAAVLLGPAGVGLVGLYQNLMQTAATVAALGLGAVGARQIAAAGASDPDAAFRARQALGWGTLALALAGALAFWIASGWLAAHVLEDPVRAPDLRWLALGVALTVATGSQQALLTGLRRIGDLARAQVSSSIAGTLLSVLAIWWLGGGALLAMVLATPFATFLLSQWFLARLDRPALRGRRMREVFAEFRAMAALGFAFMLSALVSTFGILLVRSVVQKDLGAEALGYFQAAWAVGTMYLTFVLGAMGTDYYPRLSAVIHDRERATRLVNEQTEVALLLCGPVILGVLALAPMAVHVLYSGQFSPAAAVLRWQLLGDILKVMSWPLGFVLLAAGAGKTFVGTETTGMGVIVGAVALLAPGVGIAATGMAFLLSYIFYLPLVYVLARRRIGFRWDAAVLRQAAALSVAAAGVMALTYASEMLASVAGVTLALAFGLYGCARLGQMAGLGGPIGRMATLSRQILERVGVKL